MLWEEEEEEERVAECLLKGPAGVGRTRNRVYPVTNACKYLLSWPLSLILLLLFGGINAQFVLLPVCLLEATCVSTKRLARRSAATAHSDRSVTIGVRERRVTTLGKANCLDDIQSTVGLRGEDLKRKIVLTPTCSRRCRPNRCCCCCYRLHFDEGKDDCRCRTHDTLYTPSGDTICIKLLGWWSFQDSSDIGHSIDY